jgi:hypothetical protein
LLILCEGIDIDAFASQSDSDRIWGQLKLHWGDGGKSASLSARSMNSRSATTSSSRWSMRIFEALHDNV